MGKANRTAGPGLAAFVEQGPRLDPFAKLRVVFRSRRRGWVLPPASFRLRGFELMHRARVTLRREA